MVGGMDKNIVASSAFGCGNLFGYASACERKMRDYLENAFMQMQRENACRCT